MIGRALCRLGLHRWANATAKDPLAEGGMIVRDYCWCERRGCKHETPRLMNEDRIGPLDEVPS